MPDSNKKRIRLITIIYWLLLVYIVAALVWWFISLEKQNRQMTNFKIEQLHTTTQSSSEQDVSLTKIKQEHERNLVKYISEGSTFFLLILIGAAFVYRSVRKQFLLQQQQQNFMMAVTHELKTPISVARLNLETLQKHQLDSDKQKKLIRMTLEETERLNTLTNNILVSSQLEGRHHTTKEEFDLTDLFKDCIRNFIHRFPDRKFVETVEADIDIKGDPLLLQLLINNLVENAIKYSPKEKPITCILNKHDGKATLRIIDEGRGIPAKEKKNIFKKFYRLGDEATRQTQGTGLGLYLCKKIAEDHKADITVADHLPQGSEFIVTFNDISE